MDKWEVKCLKCGHEFVTKSITPVCSKCQHRNIKWIRMWIKDAFTTSGRKQKKVR
jgi:uncharacterized OB-fold protein